MIETEHSPNKTECIRLLGMVLDAGAHYFTHAEWGCLAGVHRAWIMVDADDEAHARFLVPPVMRRNARIVALNHFTPQEVKEILETHPEALTREKTPEA
jgi:hypothetical protein